jgi:cytochrome c nitrite reductase small subunit
MSALKQHRWKILLGVIVLGGASGMFLGFGPPQLMAKTESPLFCNSCHVMESRFEAWFNVGAHRTIRCVDCHLPHENLPAYYVWKSVDGMKDVLVFYFRTREEVRAGQLHPLPHRAGGDDRPGSQMLGLPSVPAAPAGRRANDELKPIDRM